MSVANSDGVGAVEMKRRLEGDDRGDWALDGDTGDTGCSVVCCCVSSREHRQICLFHRHSYSISYNHRIEDTSALTKRGQAAGLEHIVAHRHEPGHAKVLFLPKEMRPR
jgi:hypothetical protein